MPNSNESEITKEREAFYLNDGYYVGNHKVADFEPYVVKKYITKDLTIGEDSVSYDVRVRYQRGGESESLRVEDFLKIDYFRDFSQNTVMLKKFDKLTLAFKLQQEALNPDLETEITVIAAPGYYKVDNSQIMVVADKTFCEKGVSETVKSVSPHKWLSATTFNYDTFKKYITFMPGVTEVLFYSALSAVIQPLLIETGNIPGFVTAMIAPSGHLKTTLTRLYTQWTVSSADLEVLFDDRITNDKLAKNIYAAVGLGYLIDDYHKKNREYDKRKYRDRLDTATRIASENKASAMIFITAEFIEGESIFSEQDRLLEIHIPQMNKELSEYKRRLGDMKKEEMASIAQEFAKKVMADVDKAKEHIANFVKDYRIPSWVDVTTRLGHHIMIILLTEYLFRIFMCGGNDIQSHLRDLEKALEVNGQKQTNELKLLRRKENVKSYILEIYDLLENRGKDNPDIHITVNREQYDENKIGSVYWDMGKNVCYVTSNNLADILRKRIGHAVSVKKVSEELHDYGVLIEDTDKRSVKFRSRRHYLIDYQSLKNACAALRGEVQ